MSINFRKLPAMGSTPRQTAEIVNQILDGKINAVGVVTLASSTTTTSVSDRRCGAESVILLMPTTANAAAENPYVNARSKQSFTITHANNGQTDRTYAYAILGG